MALDRMVSISLLLKLQEQNNRSAKKNNLQKFILQICNGKYQLFTKRNVLLIVSGMIDSEFAVAFF